METKDLVALIFSNNPCYTDVVELQTISDKEELKINLKNGTWVTHEKSGDIGDSCSYTSDGYKNTYGIIGIYDKTNIDHLDSMVNDGREATTDRNYNED